MLSKDETNVERSSENDFQLTQTRLSRLLRAANVWTTNILLMLVGLAKASAIYVSGFIVMDFRVAAIRNEKYREKNVSYQKGNGEV